MSRAAGAAAASLLLLSGFARAVVNDPSEAKERANARDAGVEVCAAGGPCDGEDESGLSFRQLRAVSRHQEAPSAPPGAQDEEEGDDYDPGIPGGWGEAADYTDKIVQDEKDAAESFAPMAASSRWPGSCHAYKCVTYYVRHHRCQCTANCGNYGNCCSDHSTCSAHHHHHHHNAPAPAPAPAPPPPPSNELVVPENGTILTLYHQTSMQAGPLILANGFRPGTRGWCGGGIYFAMTPEATKTKAIGADSHQGFMIEAKVDVGRVKTMSSRCDFGLTAQKVWNEGYDSVTFNPGDGQEFIVYSSTRIISTKMGSVPTN